ncbi:hypothetical protein STIUS_v1c02590 [Spiroplasma sp. TIUS-1]|uniref:hypothetical protein n=1 Tax=Spiroplasma sp. TIUS-1 TaxID=216963 RepID=UPI0013976897|nr:hypothetical protein [Spiroplasma sp. TIUS-1]QHX35813.1 hypothetical protein STIUS_v1c02590 [Spiroplasma sp. TIUS-1]
MSIKPNHKSQFPELNLLDEENKRSKYETELSELTKLEQKKFSYIPPTKVNNFAGRRLYWSTKLEVAGRILILLAALMTIITSFILGKYGILVTVEKLIGQELVFFGISLSDAISYGFLFIALLFSLFYILPSFLAKTVGTVKKWSVVFIIFAIAHFVFFELMCATLIVINSIRINNNETINDIYPIIIIMVLVTTIIQIIGSCFLIVKSDDIKQRMNLEI